MQKIIILLCTLTLFVFGQCMSGPLSSRIGIKTGVNYCMFDPEGNDNNLNGMGFHIGLGMGLDIMNLLALDMTPQYRTTIFGTSDSFLGSEITSSVSYANLYLPVQVSIKAGLPVISPYLGLGIAGNFQMSGTVKVESNGTSIEDEIEDLENDFFLIAALGAQVKLVNVSVIPEFSMNYNLTPDLVDDQNPNLRIEGSNIDLHFSLGFYMSL